MMHCRQLMNRNYEVQVPARGSSLMLRNGDQHRIRLDQNFFFTCPMPHVLHCPNDTLLMSSKNRQTVFRTWERRLPFQVTSLSYLLATGNSLELSTKLWISLVSLTT